MQPFDEAAVQSELNSRAKRNWLVKWLAAVAVGTACCTGMPVYFVGYFFGYARGKIEHGDHDVYAVEQVLATEPERFGEVSINRGPLDKFLIEGNVATQDDQDRLRQQVIRALGEEHAERVFAVEVR